MENYVKMDTFWLKRPIIFHKAANVLYVASLNFVWAVAKLETVKEAIIVNMVPKVRLQITNQELLFARYNTIAYPVKILQSVNLINTIQVLALYRHQIV